MIDTNTFLKVVLYIMGFCGILGLIRAIKGPRFTDRIVGINMVGTNGIVFTCILSVYLNEAFIVDVALVYALLSFLAVIILCRVVILHHKGRLMHMSDKEKKKYD